MRLRRRVFAVGLVLVPAVLALGCVHHGVHAARSTLVAGAGLIEARPLWAAGFLMLTVLATVAWLRWGVNWGVLVVVAVAMVMSAAFAKTTHGPGYPVARFDHEFSMVVLVAALFGWQWAVPGREPGFAWMAGRRAAPEQARSLADLHPSDRWRVVTLAALAGSIDDEALATVRNHDVARRARRVGLVARFRRGGDPFRVDHVHARAALALTDGLDSATLRRLTDDSSRTPAGVPASEPSRVRTLDGTLAAAALEVLGEPAAARQWGAMLEGPLALRRGSRPARWWSPLGVAAGRCLDWEHAAAGTVAHSRGSARRDERLIAAARFCLALVDDPAAGRIVDRPNVCHDPLAVALDRVAGYLRVALTPQPIGGIA